MHAYAELCTVSAVSIGTIHNEHDAVSMVSVHAFLDLAVKPEINIPIVQPDE